MQTSPPLVGFNNNVRYRGRRFHIQTEDSGINRPHIITHLFADGGHIIKTLRTDYSEHVSNPDRPNLVHRLMREQHLAMALDLRDGRLDATIDRLLEPSSSTAQEEPGTPPASALPQATAAPEEEGAATAPASSHTRAAAAPTPATSGPGAEVPADPAREAEPRKRSAKPKARPSLPQRKRSRPSVVLPNRPGGESIFGTAPQESLDDVILTYASAAKVVPATRRGKS